MCTGPFGRPKNRRRLIPEHVSRHTLATATFIHIPHGCLRNTGLITAHCSVNSRFKSTVKGRATFPVYVLRRQYERDGHARGFTSTDSAGRLCAGRTATYAASAAALASLRYSNSTIRHLRSNRSTFPSPTLSVLLYENRRDAIDFSPRLET